MSPSAASNRVLSADQVRGLRLRAQGLLARSAARDIATLVHRLAGVQAQEAPAAALAIRVRSTGLVTADVERARIQERSVVRTWAMRGTLHLIAADDLGWMLALFGPLVEQGRQRRYTELGLDEATRERAVRVIHDQLRTHGPLTRARIATELTRRNLPSAGQATIHLIGLAALRGQVCYGPDQDGESTFVALDDWLEVKAALPPQRALPELARRYLAAYAPAAPEDFADWSGLPLSAARAAWQAVAGELIDVSTVRGQAWVLKAQARWLRSASGPQSSVRLLPGYDTYLLGYRSRELILDPAYARRIHPGGGVLRPTVLVNGKVIGTWRIRRKGKGRELQVEPFTRLTRALEHDVENEAEDIGRFLGVAISVKVKAAR